MPPTPQANILETSSSASSALMPASVGGDASQQRLVALACLESRSRNLSRASEPLASADITVLYVDRGLGVAAGVVEVRDRIAPHVGQEDRANRGADRHLLRLAHGQVEDGRRAEAD